MSLPTVKEGNQNRQQFDYPANSKVYCVNRHDDVPQLKQINTRHQFLKYFDIQLFEFNGDVNL